MRRLAEIIHLGSHVKCISLLIAESNIHCHAIVVHTASMRWVRHIDIILGAFHHIPHLLLDAHRTGSIINLQAKMWMKRLEISLRLLQSLGSLRMEISLLQVTIQHLTTEVVSTGIHQGNQNALIHILDIHVALSCQRPCRGTQLLFLLLALQHSCFFPSLPIARQEKARSQENHYLSCFHHCRILVLHYSSPFILLINSSGSKSSILENANHFLPRSLMEAPT